MGISFTYDGRSEVFVPQDKLYEEGNYGFLTKENRGKNKELLVPELNNGFSTLSCPPTFAAEIEKEGNYQVKTELWGLQPEREICLFLGRRVMVFKGKPDKNGRLEGSFVANLSPIIPRGSEKRIENRKLEMCIALAEENAEEDSKDKQNIFGKVEVAPFLGRTIYIAGDSTVTDQSAEYPYIPALSYCGWGQMLPVFLKEPLAVSNHSHSGLTTESFRSEGHYGILYERIKKGDICLFQFGHNDQKLMHLKAEEGYRENLLRYIQEIREKEAIPVLVTPLARNSWRGDTGEYNDLLADYAQVCRRIGKEEKVPVLDLHEKSRNFILENKREKAKRYFFPSDYTHSNDYGGYLFASFIADELEDKGICRKKTGHRWLPPAKLPIRTSEEKVEDVAEESPFESVEREDDFITRAESFSFVITAMKFFPTNVYNDVFADVIGHETYAGTIECAWQNGLIPKFMIEENKENSEYKIFPEKEVTGEEFLAVLLCGYSARKSLPEGKSLIETATALGVVERDFPLAEKLSRKQAAAICKQVCI